MIDPKYIIFRINLNLEFDIYYSTFHENLNYCVSTIQKMIRHILINTV